MAQHITDLERITEGLMALVRHGGNATAAARETGLTRKTLEHWKTDTHRARYEELEARYSRELEQLAIHQMRATMVRAGEIQAELLEKVRQVDDKDLPQALRAVSDAQAKSAEKLMTLTGRPSTITENRDLGNVIKLLASRGGLKLREHADLESTAVEEGPTTTPDSSA